jgi:hypothetical protein
MQLETNKEDFLSRQELKKYDYDFLNELYIQFDHHEGCSFGWKTVDSLLEQITFHEKVINEIKPKVVLEVGTYKSMYPYFLKKNLPKVKVHTFGINEESKKCVDLVNQYFKKKFVTFYVGDSTQTLTEFDPDDIFFDMAWVDGGHTYDVAYSDLINCARLEIPEILIDDVDMGEVRRALNDFLSNSYENENGSYSYEVIDQSRSERMITRVRKVQNETN